MDELENSPAPSPEVIIVPPIPEGKVYRDKVIYRATFLGGPLAAGYMMASNFKVFGENDKVKWTWFWTILFCVVLFGLLIFLPDKILDKTPNYVFPIIYSAIAFYIAKYYQGKRIDSHINAGGKKYSGWRAFAISLIAVVILAIPIFGTYHIFDNEHTSTKTYGTLKHTIDFNEKNILSIEIDSMAKGLTIAGFFDEVQQKEVFIKKLSNTYEISIPCNSTVKDHPEAINTFVDLRNNLQTLFPAHKIVLLMIIDNLDNVYKRIE